MNVSVTHTKPGHGAQEVILDLPPSTITLEEMISILTVPGEQLLITRLPDEHFSRGPEPAAMTDR
jgi:hypothetical protein